MNDSQPSTQTRDDGVRVVLDALLEQGLLWARHGLQAGRAALETHSRATSALAESLSKLADSLHVPPPRAADVPPGGRASRPDVVEVHAEPVPDHD